MTCDEARELFSALLDEALGPEERGAVDAHVATCVDCRRELGLLRNTVALLRRVEPARAPAGFVDRVRAAARPLPRWRRVVRAAFQPWPVRLSLGATATVLVGVIIAAILRATAPEFEPAVRIEPPSPAVVTEAPRPQEPPATPSEPPRGRAQTARQRDLARAAPAPASERNAESAAGPAPPAREARKADARPDAAASRLSALRSAPTDVSGRLVVKDREAAARALTGLVAKAGGAEVARNSVAEAMVIEVTIPRAAWAEFTQDLAALGTWTPDREPAELPAEIRVALQIVE